MNSNPRRQRNGINSFTRPSKRGVSVSVAKKTRPSTASDREIANGADDVQIRTVEKNLDKFKQVVLYVLNEVGKKPNVGETVLHKLLYFIDFDYYEKFEESLMGGTYLKNHYGPTSDDLAPLIKEMQEKGEIEAITSEHFGYPQKKYLARTNPELDIFSEREINHIDEVLARLADKSATELKQLSHEDMPWKSARYHKKPLSYESVFYRDERHSVREYDDEL